MNEKITYAILLVIAYVLTVILIANAYRITKNKTFKVIIEVVYFFIILAGFVIFGVVAYFLYKLFL